MIRIRFPAGPELIVQSDSEDVAYSVEPDALTVLNAGSLANYEVLLPQDVEAISIFVGGTVVFRKRGTTISSAATPDKAGRYVVSMVDPSL